MADERKPESTDKNRPEQLNDNNEKFWKARGHDARPDDWETRTPGPAEPKKPGG